MPDKDWQDEREEKGKLLKNFVFRSKVFLRKWKRKLLKKPRFFRRKIFYENFQFESSILAQDERWRRA